MSKNSAVERRMFWNSVPERKAIYNSVSKRKEFYNSALNSVPECAELWQASLGMGR